MSWLGVTGSAAYDVVACPARVALSRCVVAGSEYAKRGNELHDFAYRVTTEPDRREEWLAMVKEEYRHTARGMNLVAALDGIRVLGCEIAFVLNVQKRTCRMIGENIGRAYAETLAKNGEEPLGKYDIPFTVDVLGESEVLDCPVELDYKSGQSIGEVEAHGQRRISAAGLMFYYGSDVAISRVAYIKENGEIVPDGHEFSVLDAWDTCETMVKAIDAAEAAKIAVEKDPKVRLTVYPNREAQCKYCAAFDACPYWTNLIKGALGKGIDDTVAPGEEGKLMEQLKDLEKVLGETLDRLREKAARTPLVIDDEWEYSVKSQEGRSSFDQAAARGVIISLMNASGASQEEIDAKLARLVKKGPSFDVFRKRKRITKQAS